MMRFTNKLAMISLLAVTGLAFGQDQPGAPDQNSQNGAPPAFGQNPPTYNQGNQQNPGAYPASPYPGSPYPGSPYPPSGAQAGYPPQGAQQGGYMPAPPPHLTVKQGTYITVRVNQWVSSDRNQAGDAFAATLDQPVVVDGVVVAQRGQTVGGRVSEAQKAGRVTGTSRLGLQLIDLTLVDGTVVPLQTSMVTRNGSTSVGRDAAVIAGSTGLGAVIGAGAAWGRGAAIGAGAGAVAGIAGVLLTRGNPTVIYPESVLTFRVDAPVEVATDRAPQAFRYAEAPDYERSGPANAACYNCAPPPVARPYPYPYGGYYAPYYGYPYYGGVGVVMGPGFYFRGRFFRR